LRFSQKRKDRSAPSFFSKILVHYNPHWKAMQPAFKTRCSSY